MKVFGLDIHDKYPKVYIEDTDKPLTKYGHNPGMRYTHFKIIGRGGKCVIKSCKDNLLNRIVAYKTLHEHLADDEIEQKRFLREARVTAALQHPNTIPIYEINLDRIEHYYFTMKLVHGYTTGGIIKQLRENNEEFSIKYSMDTLLEIILQSCNCLNYAHQHGVIHRDIKPENILTGTFGEVIVLDWGLAKVWNMPTESREITEETEIIDATLTAGQSLQATPIYMSPEQLDQSDILDHRTDIYGIGTVLYEMLTQQIFLKANSLNDVFKQVRDGSFIKPRERAPDLFIPLELEDICIKCLAVDPDQRYQSCEELIMDIRNFRLEKMGA